MRANFENQTERANKLKRQRGAALVTTLMISTLLLATGGTLILVTSLSARTAMDSTAEMQAYYSAEAGMQEALNVIRGNVDPQASMPSGSKISFRNAVTTSTSNRPADNSASCRLSGWLDYNYTPSGQSSPDRVALTAGYNPINGLAYSVEVTDPDNTLVAAGEPTRLLFKVTGYGPKGAIKRLEMIVKRTSLDYSPPAMLLMRGAETGIPVNFTSGSSAAKEYTGHDNASTAVLPTFGATSIGDMAIEIAEATKNTVANPVASTIPISSLPDFLQTADQARAFLVEQRANAMQQSRYFPTFSGVPGSPSSPAFTFVDGDCNLDTGGAGLLIVTGRLIMNGNPDFTGLILVLGEGYVERDGGGNGDVLGAMVVARFNQTSGPFLAPTFVTDGSGNALMQYDSNAIRRALNISGPRVLGVHEF